MAFFVALAAMLATGGLACFSYFAVAYSDATSVFAVCFSVFAPALLLATALSGRCCRGRYLPKRFMAWLVLWIILVPLVAMIAYGVGVVGLVIGEPDALPVILVQVILVAFPVGGVLYLLNLPVMTLAFCTPCYRDRFRSVLGLQDVERQVSPYPPVNINGDHLPVSTDHSTKPVRVQDVVGRWQFYLDAASKTVSVDFKPDGTYAQTIAGNAGGVTECPGGQWRLEESTVHLAGYVTASDAKRQSRTWWMIDTPGGLALFGGDGSQPDSFVRMTRAWQPSELPGELGRY